MPESQKQDKNTRANAGYGDGEKAQRENCTPLCGKKPCWAPSFSSVAVPHTKECKWRQKQPQIHWQWAGTNNQVLSLFQAHPMLWNNPLMSYRAASSADPRLERVQCFYDNSQEGHGIGQPLHSLLLVNFTMLMVEHSSGLPTGCGYKKEANWANTSISAHYSDFNQSMVSPKGEHCCPNVENNKIKI